MPTSDYLQFRQEVESRYRIHVAAFEALNPEPVVNEFFWEDAVWECQGYPRYEGRTRLRELFTAVIGSGHVSFVPVRSHVAGDMGWDFVDYFVKPRDPVGAGLHFRCVFVWLKRAGAWKVHACVGYTVSVES